MSRALAIVAVLLLAGCSATGNAYQDYKRPAGVFDCRHTTQMPR